MNSLRREVGLRTLPPPLIRINSAGNVWAGGPFSVGRRTIRETPRTSWSQTSTLHLKARLTSWFAALLTPCLDHEAATAKLWAVYVSEAEKYDKALVATWRSDMDGMLIFAGLFSASLTAFIIESYKTLNADSGDVSVILLAQISRQLAATMNGSSISIPEPEVFVPTTASLVCNALWFISLGLSLSCALIATLLEQWARDFLHRADMRSSPVVRARVFSYLYYGMKRFNMHAVVELIPLLLHTSLAFFLAGLVAFLLPVNKIICAFASAILASILLVYAALTILPLFHTDCPYHTPLSGTFWKLRAWSQSMMDYYGPPTQSPSAPVLSNSETIFQRAREASGQRDCRALIWTMKSLADDDELEPFIEAIPDILWGPHGRRWIDDDYIQTLVAHPQLQFTRRVDSLLRNAASGLLSKEASSRRQIACLKAIWAICSLTEPGAKHYAQFDLELLASTYVNGDTIIQYYSSSALALAQWAHFCVLGPQIDHAIHVLRTSDDLTPKSQMRPIINCIKPLQNIFQFPLLGVSPLLWHSGHRIWSDSWRKEMLAQFMDIHTHGSLLILAHYIAIQSEEPYQYDATEWSIPHSVSNLSQRTRSNISKILNVIEITQGITEVTFADHAIIFLMNIYMDGEIELPWKFFDYVQGRNSDSAVKHFLKHFTEEPLLERLAFSIPFQQTRSIHEALWHILKHYPKHFSPMKYEALLTLFARELGPKHEAGITVLLKLKLLASSTSNAIYNPWIDSDDHFLFPATTTIHLEDLQSLFDAHPQMHCALLDIQNQSPPWPRALPTFAIQRARRDEAMVLILAEFLESFVLHLKPHAVLYSGFLPWHGSIETFNLIWQEAESGVFYGVHLDHQLRLARSISNLLEQTEKHDAFMVQLLHAVGILEEPIIPMANTLQDSAPIANHPGFILRYLEDPAAQKIVKDALTQYPSRLMATSRSPPSDMLCRMIMQWDGAALRAKNIGKQALINTPAHA
ncbi:hypothetical protein C8R46DRAFT_1004732 [Mycena filopes]|nr:hypothetical protein C8R46DRAFT_1004732 [Mycena filopes]